MDGSSAPSAVGCSWCPDGRWGVDDLKGRVLFTVLALDGAEDLPYAHRAAAQVLRDTWAACERLTAERDRIQHAHDELSRARRLDLAAVERERDALRDSLDRVIAERDAARREGVTETIREVAQYALRLTNAGDLDGAAVVQRLLDGLGVGEGCDEVPRG